MHIRNAANAAVRTDAVVTTAAICTSLSIPVQVLAMGSTN